MNSSRPRTKKPKDQRPQFAKDVTPPITDPQVEGFYEGLDTPLPPSVAQESAQLLAQDKTAPDPYGMRRARNLQYGQRGAMGAAVDKAKADTAAKSQQFGEMFSAALTTSQEQMIHEEPLYLKEQRESGFEDREFDSWFDEGMAPEAAPATRRLFSNQEYARQSRDRDIKYQQELKNAWLHKDYREFDVYDEPTDQASYMGTQTPEQIKSAAVYGLAVIKESVGLSESQSSARLTSQIQRAITKGDPELAANIASQQIIVRQMEAGVARLNNERGVLDVWINEVADPIAGIMTRWSQRLIPGQQALETHYDELRSRGYSRLDAADIAYKSWDAPTALKLLIDVGFDPLNLIPILGFPGAVLKLAARGTAGTIGVMYALGMLGKATTQGLSLRAMRSAVMPALRSIQSTKAIADDLVGKIGVGKGAGVWDVRQKPKGAYSPFDPRSADPILEQVKTALGGRVDEIAEELGEAGITARGATRAQPVTAQREATEKLSEAANPDRPRVGPRRVASMKSQMFGDLAFMHENGNKVFMADTEFYKLNMPAENSDTYLARLTPEQREMVRELGEVPQQKSVEYLSKLILHNIEHAGPELLRKFTGEDMPLEEAIDHISDVIEASFRHYFDEDGNIIASRANNVFGMLNHIKVNLQSGDNVWGVIDDFDDYPMDVLDPMYGDFPQELSHSWNPDAIDELLGLGAFQPFPFPERAEGVLLTSMFGSEYKFKVNADRTLTLLNKKATDAAGEPVPAKSQRMPPGVPQRTKIMAAYELELKGPMMTPEAGADAMRLAFETRLARGDIDEKVYETAMEFLDMIPPDLLEDVSLSIWKHFADPDYIRGAEGGGTLGMFHEGLQPDAAQAFADHPLIELFLSSMDTVTPYPERTFVHEVGHSFERFLPEKWVKSLTKEAERDIRENYERVKREADRVVRLYRAGLVGKAEALLATRTIYRYQNIHEWIAETMADHAMRDMGRQALRETDSLDAMGHLIDLMDRFMVYVYNFFTRRGQFSTSAKFWKAIKSGSITADDVRPLMTRRQVLQKWFPDAPQPTSDMTSIIEGFDQFTGEPVELMLEQFIRREGGLPLDEVDIVFREVKLTAEKKIAQEVSQQNALLRHKIEMRYEAHKIAIARRLDEIAALPVEQRVPTNPIYNQFMKDFPEWPVGFRDVDDAGTAEGYLIGLGDPKDFVFATQGGQISPGWSLGKINTHMPHSVDMWINTANGKKAVREVLGRGEDVPIVPPNIDPVQAEREAIKREMERVASHVNPNLVSQDPTALRDYIANPYNIDEFLEPKSAVELPKAFNASKTAFDGATEQLLDTVKTLAGLDLRAHLTYAAVKTKGMISAFSDRIIGKMDSMLQHSLEEQWAFDTATKDFQQEELIVMTNIAAIQRIIETAFGGLDTEIGRAAANGERVMLKNIRYKGFPVTSNAALAIDTELVDVTLSSTSSSGTIPVTVTKGDYLSPMIGTVFDMSQRPQLYSGLTRQQRRALKEISNIFDIDFRKTIESGALLDEGMQMGTGTYRYMPHQYRNTDAGMFNLTHGSTRGRYPNSARRRSIEDTEDFYRKAYETGREIETSIVTLAQRRLGSFADLRIKHVLAAKLVRALNPGKELDRPGRYIGVRAVGKDGELVTIRRTVGVDESGKPKKIQRLDDEEEVFIGRQVWGIPQGYKQTWDEFMNGAIGAGPRAGKAERIIDETKAGLLNLDMSIVGGRQGQQMFAANPRSYLRAMREFARITGRREASTLWLAENLEKMLDWSRHGLNLGTTDSALAFDIHGIPTRGAMDSYKDINGVDVIKDTRKLGRDGFMIEKLPGLKQFNNNQFQSILIKGKVMTADAAFSLLQVLRDAPGFRDPVFGLPIAPEAVARPVRAGVNWAADMAENFPILGSVVRLWRKHFDPRGQRMTDDQLREIAADFANNWIGGIRWSKIMAGRPSAIRKFTILTEGWTRARIGNVINAGKPTTPKGILARRMFMQELLLVQSMALAYNAARVSTREAMFGSGFLDPRSRDFNIVYLEDGTRVRVMSHSAEFRKVAHFFFGTPDDDNRKLVSWLPDSLDEPLKKLNYALDWFHDRRGQWVSIGYEQIKGETFMGEELGSVWPPTSTRIAHAVSSFTPIMTQEVVQETIDRAAGAKKGVPWMESVSVPRLATEMWGWSSWKTPMRQRMLAVAAKQLGKPYAPDIQVKGKAVGDPEFIGDWTDIDPAQRDKIYVSPEGRQAVLYYAEGAQRERLNRRFWWYDKQISNDNRLLQGLGKPGAEGEFYKISDWVNDYYNTKMQQAMELKFEFHHDDLDNYVPVKEVEKLLDGYYKEMEKFKPDPADPSAVFDNQGWERAEKEYIRNAEPLEGMSKQEVQEYLKVHTKRWKTPLAIEYENDRPYLDLYYDIGHHPSFARDYPDNVRDAWDEYLKIGGGDVPRADVKNMIAAKHGDPGRGADYVVRSIDALLRKRTEDREALRSPGSSHKDWEKIDTALVRWGRNSDPQSEGGKREMDKRKKRLKKFNQRPKLGIEEVTPVQVQPRLGLPQPEDAAEIDVYGFGRSKQPMAAQPMAAMDVNT